MALGILISMITAMGLTHHVVRTWLAFWKPRSITL
jgi:preprotein translocase subunit SecD